MFERFGMLEPFGILDRGFTEYPERLLPEVGPDPVLDPAQAGRSG